MKRAPSAAPVPRVSSITGEGRARPSLRTHRQLCRFKFASQLFLRPRAHREGIDVLPPGLADIDSAHFSLRGHESDSVRQAAIAVSAGAAQVIEELVRAEEHAGVDRIV